MCYIYPVTAILWPVLIKNTDVGRRTSICMQSLSSWMHTIGDKIEITIII